MNDTNAILSKDEIAMIQKLASEKRLQLNYTNNAPVTYDLFGILDNLNIHLLEYPIRSSNGTNAFSAVIFCNTINDKKYTFLGLNTSNLLTEQYFAIAHELYHFFTNDNTTMCSSERTDEIEMRANRFAAEFLLPETALTNILLDEFGKTSLYNYELPVLLRFIARIHCTWWLPYISIVRRLHEIEAISIKQCNTLLIQDINDENSYFPKICKAINPEIYHRINSATNKIGTSPKNIEIFIRNYENNAIDDDTFLKILKIFNLDPSYFGYNFEISDEDYNDLEDVLEKTDS